MNALRVHGDVHRVSDIFKIIQWLAHAHQYDIRQKPCGRGRIAPRRGPFAQIIPSQHHLADNLPCGEVAHQFLRTRVAKGAGEGTADLTADAQRAAIGFRNIDGFHLMPASNAHQIFACAICGDLLGDHFGDGDHEMLRQKRAVVFGQICHLLKIAHALFIDPLPELPEPHFDLLFRGASCNQGLAQRIARQAHQIDGPLRQFAWQGHEIMGDRRGGTSHGCYPYEEGPALAGPGVFANRMGQFSRRSVSQNR